jgi:hypothetical protein
MPSYKIRVKVKGTDKLWNVELFQENGELFDFTWHRRNGYSEYSSDELKVIDDDKFFYKLVVKGQNTIEYEYLVEIMSGDVWKKLDGDTRTIIKRRRDEISKNVPIPTEITPLA